MNLTVIWRFLLGACELIHIFVCEGQNCNNYSGNTKLHHKQLSCPGAPVFHRRFAMCNCGPRFRMVPVVPTFLSALSIILKSSRFPPPPFLIVEKRLVDVIALLGCYTARFVVAYRSFWATYPSHPEESSSPRRMRDNMGPICCAETSINKYQPTPRNIPEERKPQLGWVHTCNVTAYRNTVS